MLDEKPSVLASAVNQKTLRQSCPIEFRKVLKYGLRGIPKAFILGGLIFAGLIWNWSRQNPELELTTIILNHASILLSVGALLIIGAFAHPVLYFFTYFYDVDGKNVIIRKGVFAKREITLPFSRITDVNVEQDLLDVMLGLYDIHISSPTSESGKFAHIDGVGKKSARKIKQLLLEGMNTVNFDQRASHPGGQQKTG